MNGSSTKINGKRNLDGKEQEIHIVTRVHNLMGGEIPPVKRF